MSTPINPEEFLSFNSSSRAIKRARTATGNYVATVLKPTTVTHSCVGCFTGPNHLNLIICKGSLVEIYLMIENELQPILDFPVVEKVVFMELSHLPLATEDFLFIATELYKFCVLGWDAQSSKLITINTMRYQSPRLATWHLNYCQVTMTRTKAQPGSRQEVAAVPTAIRILLSQFKTRRCGTSSMCKIHGRPNQY